MQREDAVSDNNTKLVSLWSLSCSQSQLTIGPLTSKDMVHPMRIWPACCFGVPEPVERYFLQEFHRWHVDRIEVVSVDGVILPSDPMLLSLQTIAGLKEKARDPIWVALRQWGTATLMGRDSHSFYPL